MFARDPLNPGDSIGANPNAEFDRKFDADRVVRPTSIALPRNEPPSGWKRYVSTSGCYALHHPPNWKVRPGGGSEEDANFSPGPDPYTGPVWLTVQTPTAEDVEVDGGGCSTYNVGSSIYHKTGPFTIGGARGMRYSASTPKGYPSEPSFGTVVNVSSGGRCFQFDFTAPSKTEWDANAATALGILGTVVFGE